MNFEIPISKCPTSQQIVVRIWRTNQYYWFVPTDTNDCLRRQANTEIVTQNSFSCHNSPYYFSFEQHYKPGSVLDDHLS